MSAIRYAMLSQFENAIYATTSRTSFSVSPISFSSLLVVAAFVDGLDGPIARMLHATSQV